MSKVIKCELDTDSLDKAIQELEKYRQGLESKLKMFVDSLINAGVQVANIRLSQTVGDSTDANLNFAFGVWNGDIVSAYIELGGKDALFVEFGAGIAYNTGAQHPLASKYGYGVGTYPSKYGHNRAINPGYWFFRDPPGSKNVVRSIGTMATMPIYYAAETMRNNAIMKATEILAR